MKLLFMGTPQFAVRHLRALAQEKHEILGVATRPDRPAGRGQRLTFPQVKTAALELDLPVLQPKTLNDNEFRAEIERLQPDVVCVVAYGGFLPEWLLELPPKGCVNVHPSLLPKYRGAAPIQRALMNGDRETGLSTMYMVEAMDAGDVILQERITIGSDDDAGSLHDRLAEVGARLLCETLTLIEKGTAPRIPQDESLVTFAPKIERSDELIEWERSATQIGAIVRGLRPRPGAYTMFEGRRVKVWQARVSEHTQNDRPPPGTVVNIDEDAITVATGKGMLDLLEVQPENAKRLKPGAFANGYRLSVGERFVAE